MLRSAYFHTQKQKNNFSTAWSDWRCTQNCGDGKQQKRTRQCYGCSGKTYEVRNHNCKKQNPCYCKRSSNFLCTFVMPFCT